MTAGKDPEQRIADLERALSDSAAQSEVASEGPRVGLRLGWIAFALMVIGLIVGAGAILASRGDTPVAGRPTMIGGGGTVAETPSATTIPSRTPAPQPVPPVAPPGVLPPARTPGGAVAVAGVGNERTIACTDNEAIDISGVNNTVTLTGHCSRVDVSGLENVVTVDSADEIVVSGLNNAVTFHSGTPELSNSGLGNTVGQG